MSVANHNALSFFIVIQPSGSNKTELEIVSVMNEIGFPKESLATAAALRKQMERSNNNLVTLADEYRSTLSSRGGGLILCLRGLIFGLSRLILGLRGLHRGGLIIFLYHLVT